MYSTLTEKRIATLAANVIYEALNTYQARYKGITQRARMRFKNRDWHSMQRWRAVLKISRSGSVSKRTIRR